jgi:hypothetical protein
MQIFLRTRCFIHALPATATDEENLGAIQASMIAISTSEATLRIQEYTDSHSSLPL